MTRAALAAPALLLMGSPWLFFPELIPAAIRTPFVGIGTGAALVVAVALLGGDRSTQALVAVLGLAALIAWWPVRHSPAALSHFAGFGLGLMVMSVVGAWGRSEERVLWIALAVLLAGALVVSLAFAATRVRLVGPEIRPRVFPVVFNSWVPYLDIERLLPGIVRHGEVNKNALGAAALLVTPLAAGLVWLQRRSGLAWTTRLIGAIVALVGAYVCLVAESRSAWIAAWAVLVAAAWRFAHGWRRRLAVFLLLGFPLLAGTGLRVLAPAQFDAYAARMNLSGASRFNIQDQALGRLLESRGLGIGFSQFREVREPAGPEAVPHAHNIFLQTGLDLGVIGLAAYAGLIGLLVVRAARVARGRSVAACTAAGAGLVLFGVHVFGLADAVALGARIGIFQWVAAGLILAAWRVSQTCVRAPVNSAT